MVRKFAGGTGACVNWQAEYQPICEYKPLPLGKFITKPQIGISFPKDMN
jgi:hypothetical protein